MRSKTSSFQFFLIVTILLALLPLSLVSIIIPRGEEVLFINQFHQPIFDLLFPVITNFGSALIFLPILVWTLFIEFRLSVITLLAAIVHGIVVLIGKRILFSSMLRPTAVIDNDLLYLIPNVDFHTTHSFPSGHTATAFAAAVVLILIAKRKDITLTALTLAVLVGFSRIYLLQHFLQDVVVGAMVGIISAWFAFQILNEKRNWPDWMSERIRIQLPKPKSGQFTIR